MYYNLKIVRVFELFYSVAFIAVELERFVADGVGVTVQLRAFVFSNELGLRSAYTECPFK